MPEEEVSSSNEKAGGEAVDSGTPPVDGSAATTEKEEGRKQWFIEMRGWIMMVAAQVAAFTYQAGVNPPDHFTKDKGKCSYETEKSTNFRKNVFFCSNTTAFLTSLAIIILLMNRSFYCSFAKVTVLEIIVVLDMIGLMAAYWAGSTCDNQTNVFALVLAALVLFVVYVVYKVQLVQKLYAVPLVRKLWGLFAAVVQRRVPAPAPARAATRDDDGGTPPVLNQQDIIDDGTWAPPTLDIGCAKSELRRRDSRLLQRTPGKSSMQSP